MKSYNWKKTIWKGFKSILQMIFPVLLVYLQTTGVADMTITDVIIKFAPWFGALTVGGVIIAGNNWLKNH